MSLFLQKGNDKMNDRQFKTMPNEDEMPSKAGIPKIMLPYLPEEITPELVIEELPNILAKQRLNATRIEYLLNFVDGTFQDIDTKKRLFEAEKERNQKVKENHAFALVNFKEGFLLGNRREFAQKSDVLRDDLIYLDRFLSDSGFYSKDIKIKHNIYSTGIGTSYVMPRTDIIKNVSPFRAVFNKKTDGYDIDNDSPFIYEVLDSCKNAVVYTNRIGVYGDGALFCFSLRNIEGERDSYTEVTVWTKEWTAKFTDKTVSKTEFSIVENSYKNTPPGYKYIPMVEHSLNESRVGIIEINLSDLNTVNLIASTSLDNVVDLVNQILVFIGAEIKREDLLKMYEAGAICIPITGGVAPSIDTITLPLEYDQVNVMFEQRLARLYDIAGVPLASASVTSGGDTGQARLLGGGWTNAYTIINRDILALESADRELLKRFIASCKINPDNKVNETHANQIDIKYNINMSDNLQVKTQSMMYLNDMQFPLEDILRAIPIVSDVKTVSRRWQENQDKAKIAEQSALENKTEKSIIATEQPEKAIIAK